MIKNVIFDLGHVLINVDYTKFRNKLTADGVAPELYNTFFTGQNYRNLGYEAGKITTRQFVDKCVKELGLKMSGDEFANAFNDMFSEIKPMSDLVRKFNREGRYNLYLLSNTSPLHFGFIKQQYDYLNLLDNFALSFELKSLKPEDGIYSKALELFNAKSEESVFIDDLPENCEGAERIGIKSIQYDLLKHDDFILKFDEILNRN